jgi:hypothetical protein
MIRCPACRQKYHVPLTHYGKKVRCARCRAGFLIDRMPKPGAPAVTQRLLVGTGAPLPEAEQLNPEAAQAETQPDPLPQKPVEAQTPEPEKLRIPAAIAPVNPTPAPPREAVPPGQAKEVAPEPVAGEPAQPSGAPTPGETARKREHKKVPVIDLLVQKKKPRAKVEDVSFFRGLMDVAQCDLWLIGDGIQEPQPQVNEAHEAKMPEDLSANRAKRHSMIRRRSDQPSASHEGRKGHKKTQPERQSDSL